MSIFKQGFQAFAFGYTKEENPFPITQFANYIDWKSGWQQAADEDSVLMYVQP